MRILKGLNLNTQTHNGWSVMFSAWSIKISVIYVEFKELTPSRSVLLEKLIVTQLA
jgi:hypothetical protein